jgi:hypothetical protein
MLSPKENQIKKDTGTLKSYLMSLYLIWSIVILTGCGSDSDKNATSALDSLKHAVPEKSRNFDEVDYQLPQSGYTVKIKITKINTKVSKHVFSTKAEQYAVAKKVDGYFLAVRFMVTNPYDHEMMIPVPDYFYITAENSEWFSSSTTYHKQCHCDIDNSTEVLTANGKNLYQVSEGRCVYNNYCIKFKAKESKEFKINFTDPILGSVKKLAFNGFDIRWNNPNYTVEQDKGLIIDMDKKVIVGEKRF